MQLKMKLGHVMTKANRRSLNKGVVDQIRCGGDSAKHHLQRISMHIYDN